MPNFTENAIKESFIKLLNEKAFSQITVKDIVEDCGINRNSFYYHYADIPSLVEDIIKSEVDNIFKEYTTVDSIETCLIASVDFAKKEKRAIMHIYNSVNRAIFEQYLWKVADYVVRSFFDSEPDSKLLEAKDRELLVTLLKCECFGIVIEWIDRGMGDDIYDNIHRLSEMRSGSIEEIMKRVSEKQ